LRERVSLTQREIEKVRERARGEEESERVSLQERGPAWSKLQGGKRSAETEQGREGKRRRRLGFRKSERKRGKKREKEDCVPNR
jgi:hypothetical protein